MEKLTSLYNPLSNQEYNLCRDRTAIPWGHGGQRNLGIKGEPLYTFVLPNRSKDKSVCVVET
jgi:hypothetical protein